MKMVKSKQNCGLNEGILWLNANITHLNVIECLIQHDTKLLIISGLGFRSFALFIGVLCISLRVRNWFPTGSSSISTRFFPSYPFCLRLLPAVLCICSMSVFVISAHDFEDSST